MEGAISNGIESVSVMVPANASVQDKILILSMWQKEYQEAGYNIISTKPYTDDSFIMEIRRFD